MAIYTGFSTTDVNTPVSKIVSGVLTTNTVLGKKFSLTDQELVTRDLMNALSIRQGDKVGRPEYGTNIWSYIFDPNTDDLIGVMEDEIRRVVSLDPRIIINDCQIFPQDNEVLIELEVAFSPFNEAIDLSLSLSKSTGTVAKIS